MKDLMRCVVFVYFVRLFFVYFVNPAIRGSQGSRSTRRDPEFVIPCFAKNTTNDQRAASFDLKNFFVYFVPLFFVYFVNPAIRGSGFTKSTKAP